MENVLNRIVAHVRGELPGRKQRLPLEKLKEQADNAPPPRGFSKNFPTVAEARGGRPPALIAEVKRASPSKGVLRDPFDPLELATDYEKGGASAVSVLTEEKFFQGNLDYLERIRSAVALPLLRKDFIIDPYQILEARARGADAVLLIAAVLEDGPLADLHARAGELGLEALIEVHDEGEMGRALKAGAELIGVNNRDLKDFGTDLAVTERLASMVPEALTLVSESGIRSREDVLRVGARGAGAVLVGEAIVRERDVRGKVAELTGHGV